MLPPAPVVSPPAPPPAANPPRTVAPEAVPSPPIAGHSFLGLNQPLSSESKRGATLGGGSQLERSSQSLDYLLDDEEEPRGGGAGKIFLILVIAALAVGFSYFRWHDQISALLSGTKKAPAAEQTSSDAAQAPANTAADLKGAATPAPTASQPATPTADNTHGSAPASAPAAQPTDSAGTNAGSPDNHPADSAAPETSTNQPAPKNADSNPASDSETADDTAATNTPAPAPARNAKPHAALKPTPARPSDAVAEAERYIYGRGGSTQDCDRGLRVLRPAAEQANSNAMISLGALYSTGVCTPRDLPTAYRWFAKALRKEPENQPLQENLQRLWSQMTQPERQLAIKLSQ